MYYTPSIGMLSSDPLGMPDAEGVGRAVPPSGGVSLLPPNACGGDDWPRGMAEDQSWELFLGE